MSARYTAGLPTRSAYENMLAEHIRGKLFAMLGPTCAGCECDLHGIAWEFNHLYRREWKPRKLSRYRRNCRYLREAQAGLGDLRCPACNREYRPVHPPPHEPAPPADMVPF